MKNVTLGIFLLSLFFCCGCIEHYDYKQYRVKVIDSEQVNPVGNASISVVYLIKKPVLNWPKTIETTTDENGIAEFKVANFYAPAWRIKADGYVPLSVRGYFDDYRIPEDFEVQNDGEIIIRMKRDIESSTPTSSKQ